jgi:hypothetical protein
MQAVTTIGLDIAKSVFQIHGVDSAGNVIVRRQLKRRYVLPFFQKLPPCLIGIEACASSHHWYSGFWLALLQAWQCHSNATDATGSTERLPRSEASAGAEPHLGSGRLGLYSAPAADLAHRYIAYLPSAGALGVGT